MITLPPLPYKVSDEVMAKAAKVKLALFDVDGVLTDGTLHYSADGEQMKVFHALDGHGLKMLKLAGIDVGVISARKSMALQARLNDLGIKHCYLGVSDKRAVFDQLLEQLDLSGDDCCFVGDDVIDLPVMTQCGLKFSVDNGHFIVRDIADWVSPLTGGQGAVRSICDVLLYSQGSYPLGITGVQ
ncbi:MAG: 3-deoxy-D-manno-octulosonate 8-phosphate phosphatase (KDO 8-P phosphatase) [Arenicella sp.]|jgi:3-deoxy-D-manno-octulosonate 8-phosphate phosphatase (KDO 8-P phosphatase)